MFAMKGYLTLFPASVTSPQIAFLKYSALLCCPVNDNMPSKSEICVKGRFFIVGLHCVIKHLKVRITLYHLR